jgi:hypothetical protein
MGYQSRFGIDPKSLTNTEPPMAPKCNPCTEGDHGRCATVLGPEHGDVIDTDYRCPCYYADEETHQGDFDERQERKYERDDWSPEWD